MGLLASLWKGIKALPGLIFPFLVKAGDWRHWSPLVRWTVHFLVLALFLVLLGYLNYLFDLERILRAPLPMLRKVWLPLLFLLIYIQGWLGFYLWKILGAEEEGSAYPDIDSAWAEAVQALAQADIDIREVPLFLVLGQPRGGLANLFVASHLNLTVRSTGHGASTPLQVYANREGIYVTCAGVSLLARQSFLLLEQESAPQTASPAPWSGPPGAASGAAQPGLDPAQAATPVLTWDSIPAPEPEKAGGVATEPLLALEQVDLNDLGQPETPSQQVQPQRPLLLQKTQETEQCTARLKHLCVLIGKSRQPYCPANGLLLLLPWELTETETDATHAGRLCQRELDIIRDALHLQVPAFALVCDMERELGFREVLARLPEAQRLHRLGLRLPLVPDVKPEEVPGVVERGVEWVCDTLFPLLIYRLLRLPPKDAANPSLVERGNVRLHQLLVSVWQRRLQLGHLVKRGFLSARDGQNLFGGFFFGATGTDPTQEQGFITNVMALLVENQNFVSWTAEALHEDRRYRLVTRAGYALALVLMATLFILGFYFWYSG
jgi:hypothetical protein